MQRAKHNRREKLENFFLSEGPELHRVVQEVFPKLYNGQVSMYLKRVSNAKGLVVEQYVAVLLDLWLPQKEISYRHRIIVPRARGGDVETDIDLVVACHKSQLEAVFEQHKEAQNIEVLKFPQLNDRPNRERKQSTSLARMLADACKG
jgi:hypothetical protein